MDVHLPRSGGRGQPVGTRICLLLAALALLAFVYLLVSPLERPTSQGPPFDCGTALTEPPGGFASAVCGDINLRRQLQAGAVGLAAVVLAGGGWLAFGPAWRRRSQGPPFEDEDGLPTERGHDGRGAAGMP
jgi:hypothetical protein